MHVSLICINDSRPEKLTPPLFRCYQTWRNWILKNWTWISHSTSRTDTATVTRAIIVAIIVVTAIIIITTCAPVEVAQYEQWVLCFDTIPKDAENVAFCDAYNHHNALPRCDYNASAGIHVVSCCTGLSSLRVLTHWLLLVESPPLAMPTIDH